MTGARVGGFLVHELVFPERHASFLDPEDGYVAVVLEGRVDKTFPRRTLAFPAGLGLTMPAGAAHALAFRPRLDDRRLGSRRSGHGPGLVAGLLADVRQLREALVRARSGGASRPSSARSTTPGRSRQRVSASSSSRACCASARRRGRASLRLGSSPCASASTSASASASPSPSSQRTPASTPPTSPAASGAATASAWASTCAARACRGRPRSSPRRTRRSPPSPPRPASPTRATSRARSSAIRAR